MNKCKKVLVLGATGAMGQYLVPLLAEQGCQVDAVALDRCEGAPPGVRCLQANAKASENLLPLLSNGYDGIVDFLIYRSAELPYYLPLLLDNTEHYIYLSSYRVYDNLESPVKETSARLIDAADKILLRNSDDYCICKARGENILYGLEQRNWTVVRPAITYSRLRYQLVTLEGKDTLGRARAGKKVVLPEQAREVPATMSWAGDVAAMIAGLLFKRQSLGETYTAATAEHHTWGEIAGYYQDLCGLEAVWVDKEEYLRIIDPDAYNLAPRWQLEYDRLFARVMDNAKILAATDMRQSGLMPLYQGLKQEIERCPTDLVWPVNTRMDAFLEYLR
ncbi:MAG: hypothetical protein GX564_05565 [Oligosphaeraceae bacterium]|nr:hypothetical protein [Oligosphaeraceae bacterium]